MPRIRVRQQPSGDYFHDFGRPDRKRRNWAGGVRSAAVNLLAFGSILALSVGLGAQRGRG
jgi:hypothetical protein